MDRQNGNIPVLAVLLCLSEGTTAKRQLAKRDRDWRAAILDDLEDAWTTFQTARDRNFVLRFVGT